MAVTPASALQVSGANATPTRGWQSYTPILAGQTDNAVATYTTQVGKFQLVGNICFFKFALVTSGTTTKTTTTDNFQVTLPLLSATNAGTSVGEQFACRVENATCVENAQVGVIASNVQFAIFQAYVIGTVAATLTWATTSPGIGVLSHVITAIGSGAYEFAPY